MTRYRADIDGLRAVAVLAVLGFHLFPGIARGGFVGVDVFFVISGFLISSVLMEDLDASRPLLLRFYLRRVRRIFPALIVLLAAVLAGGWFLLLAREYAALGKHVAGGAGFTANFLYWNEAGYFDRAASAKPLLHLWSLGVEEQFYLVWPLLLMLIWRQRFRAGLFAGLLLASFALSLFAVRTGAAAAFYSPVDRFWELLTGGALAFVARDARMVSLWRSRPLARNLASLTGVALIAVAVVRINGTAAFPGWKALLPVGGTALVIAGGSRAWINARALSLRPVVWVGLISYPLYLWHWPLFSLARIVSGELSVAARLEIAAASVILAAATYSIVERPVRTRAASLRLAAILCTLMAVVFGAGLETFLNGGHAGRLPAPVRELADFSYDSTSDTRGHTCLLFPDEGERVFGADCFDPTPERQALPEIALWGDSHAGHLYPGLLARYHQAFRISQLTAGGCPPLLRTAGRWDACVGLTDGAFETIARRKPAIVLLSARWINYDLRSLPATIARLRAAGIRRVVVAGQAPVWDGRFPDILARLALNDRPGFRVPERTTARLVRRVFDIDRDMASQAQRSGAEYESPLQWLCNDDGCLTRVGGQTEDVTAFDDSHLTPAASRYLVARFSDLGGR